MRKIAVLFLLYIFVVFPVYLHAFNWSAGSVTVVETKKVDNKNQLNLKDKDGNIFSVSYVNDIDDEIGKKILELESDFFKWSAIQVESLKFNVSLDNTIQINIVPSKFQCSGTDVLQYLPGGMLFFYTDALEYNFRITKDNLFIRIKGQFVDEAKLCGQIIEAVNNPHAYIRKRDPEYFLKAIEKLETDLGNLRDEYDKLRYAVLMFENKGFFGGMSHVKKETIIRIVKMKKGNPKLTEKDIMKQLEKEKIDVSGKAVRLILNIYFNEFE